MLEEFGKVARDCLSNGHCPGPKDHLAFLVRSCQGYGRQGGLEDRGKIIGLGDRSSGLEPPLKSEACVGSSMELVNGDAAE